MLFFFPRTLPLPYIFNYNLLSLKLNNFTNCFFIQCFSDRWGKRYTKTVILVNFNLTNANWNKVFALVGNYKATELSFGVFFFIFSWERSFLRLKALLNWTWCFSISRCAMVLPVSYLSPALLLVSISLDSSTDSMALPIFSILLSIIFSTWL